MTAQDGNHGSWTFLTNHGHVLICLARDPQMRIRDVAVTVGVTERAVQSIIADLESAGYLERKRAGRRNRYEMHPDLPMRHPVEQMHSVAELLEVLGPSGGASSPSGGATTLERPSPAVGVTRTPAAPARSRRSGGGR